MTHYIVEQHSKRYGPFDSPHEADRWAERVLEWATYSVVYLRDTSEAEPPSLRVGDVVQVKDRNDQTGITVYVPGGAQGVVTHVGNKKSDPVNVVFHAPHDDNPRRSWASQRVNGHDLVKVDRYL